MSDVPPLNASSTESEWEQLYRDQMRREFVLSWDDPAVMPDPEVLIDGEDVTRECAWIRLEPGGRAVASLFCMDSSGHRIIDGEIAHEEIRGRYKVRS